MPAHPLWRAYEPPSSAEVAAARVGDAARRVAHVAVVEPDATWPDQFDRARNRIVEALQERALSVDHIGSTAVPGLWAKPIIDIVLTVADSSDEDAWLPDLELAGFVLTVREHGWEEHRLLRDEAPRINLHVFSTGAREPQRQVMFRDWLRDHPEDREQYAQVKRQVAAAGYTDEMLYNNAKSGFVYDLYEKIFAADTNQQHDARPRRENQWVPGTRRVAEISGEI